MSGAVGTTPDSIEAAVQALLAGQAALEPPPDLGRWTETYKALWEAHQAGGPPEVQRVWEVLIRSHPELARMQIDKPWPERQALPTLPSVPALPPELLPPPLRGWLIDIATRACIPLEYVAAPAVVALGAVVGRALGIRPGRYDDYLVVPNLWGGIIGRPGTMKSSAVSEALNPLARLAAEARTAYQAILPSAAAKCDRIAAEMTAIKAEMVKRAKPGRRGEGQPDLGELQDRLAEKRQELSSVQVFERRYMTQDATTEKLGALLVENPRGLLVARDELAGWLRTMERPGREGDREFYLEAWNGTGSYTFDRIGRGTVHVPALTVSIVGGIQPGKLRHYIAEALSDGGGADGLLQRLQVLVWPDRLEDWRAPARWPDSEAKGRAYAVYRWLDALQDDLAEHAEAWKLQGGDIPTLRFDHEAQALHDAWREELEARLRGEALAPTPAFEAHVAKYRSLMPALALLWHLVAVADGAARGPVALGPARLAAAWCAYLEGHARKVYAAELSPGLDGAHTLAAKIQAGESAHGSPIRDLYRPQWSGLRTSGAVRAAIEVLASAGWVRTRLVETGGRESEVLDLHPDFRQGGGAHG